MSFAASPFPCTDRLHFSVEVRTPSWASVLAGSMHGALGPPFPLASFPARSSATKIPRHLPALDGFLYATDLYLVDSIPVAHKPRAMCGRTISSLDSSMEISASGEVPYFVRQFTRHVDLSHLYLMLSHGS